MSGKPVFNGTRVPVRAMLAWLETETLDEFLLNFPSVSREQAIEVLKLRPYNSTRLPLAADA